MSFTELLTEFITVVLVFTGGDEFEELFAVILEEDEEEEVAEASTVEEETFLVEISVVEKLSAELPLLEFLLPF